MTEHLAIASDAAEAVASEKIQQHHAELVGALAHRVQVLMQAVAAGNSDAAEGARGELASWCMTELVPHAKAEEEAMYPAAQGLAEGRLLVAAMVQEHQDLVDLIRSLPEDGALEAAARATALQVLFAGHARKENELLLPLLAGRPEISLAGMLEAMHVRLAEPSSAKAGTHECGCHEHDDDVPELDARVIPHAIRHATIFGALGAVRPGRSMVLIAPHDPLPLLAQVEQRQPGEFSVAYLERGPEAWRLQFARSA